MALPALGSSKPELDEGLVCLSTGVLLVAHTLVDNKRVYSLLVPLLADCRPVKGGLTDYSLREFQLPTGLEVSHFVELHGPSVEAREVRSLRLLKADY